MKLSVRSDYAARAVLGLARRYQSGAAVRLEDLAMEQGISANFLAQVLLDLKTANLVRSVRGKEGGYLLARAPAEITLGDILRCVYGHILDTPALNDPNCPGELRDAWKGLQTAMQSAADTTTFQGLLDGASAREKMYYI